MALRDKDGDQGKPAADLLRRSLASAASAPGSDIDGCPDPEILAAYSERSLDADETARYELHFSLCARCREQLAALVRADELAGTVKEKHSRVPGMGWIRTRNWDWRLLAPVTAALMLVIIVATFRPTRQPVVQAPQPLVDRLICCSERLCSDSVSSPVVGSMPNWMPPVIDVLPVWTSRVQLVLPNVVSRKA